MYFLGFSKYSNRVSSPQVMPSSQQMSDRALNIVWQLFKRSQKRQSICHPKFPHLCRCWPLCRQTLQLGPSCDQRGRSSWVLACEVHPDVTTIMVGTWLLPTTRVQIATFSTVWHWAHARWKIFMPFSTSPMMSYAIARDERLCAVQPCGKIRLWLLVLVANSYLPVDVTASL